MDEILKYFPYLSDHQQKQFAAAVAAWTEWNARINVVSRKDIDNIFEHHILHSLAIAKFFTPEPGTEFMDLGCGGGFPGLPLAILWPDCRFHLVDRVAKKLRVASEVIAAAEIGNVTTQHGDAGECHRKFDFVVSRAVMPLPDLARISRRNIARTVPNRIAPGLLCLKGGDLAGEIAAVGGNILDIPLSYWFDEPFFETKQLIYVNL
ncbi:MAG: 16S rRNA (guanine(527)-N(7))-methyltransferase RsmG [Clostridium sp.]|nr:16S rRNA (guanine(527)-N(7))-methyltransferase RsmG [Clostridium sp.]